MYAADHLSAAIQLCKIQTVLGRAKVDFLNLGNMRYSRLFPSDSHEFVEKNVGTETANQTVKAGIKTENTNGNLLKKKSIVKKIVPPSVTIDEYADPLKVSPRLATFIGIGT